MARQNAQLLAFNRGEVSKIALARVDVAKLALAAQCQVNWLPFVVGPAMLRPGLNYIGEILNDSPAWLIDFVYAKTDTSLIELTDGTMRVWIDDVLLTRPSVATAISDPVFNGGGTWVTSDTSSGASTTIGGGNLVLTCTPIGGNARAYQAVTVAGGDQAKEHGVRVAVSNGPVTFRIGTADGLGDILGQTALDTGTHSLSFVPNAATIYVQIESTDQWNKFVTRCSIESAGVVTLPTPWAAADLPNLRWTQSGDIVYVACYGRQQYKIERRGTRPGARGWSTVAYRSNTGPFRASPDIVANFSINQIYGNAVLTSDRPYFVAGHVGALLQMFTPGQFNSTILGAPNAFGPAIRVSGIDLDRTFTVIVAGTWAGTISLQRSLIGPDSGFVTVPSTDGGWASVPTLTGNFSINFLDDKSTTSGVAYDNVIAWYRLGFEAGNYISGNASAQFNYSAGGGTGICRINAVNSSTSVNVEVVQPFTCPKATQDWQISDWCAQFGFPTSVGFAEGRLWWLSGGTIPIAASESNNYTGFAQQDVFGNTLGDAGAILESFGEGPSDSVTWLLSLQRLLCGREQSIASIRSSSIDTPLTPTNFAVKDCSQQGAARLPPIKIGKNGIYVQQNNNRVYELTLSNPYLSDYNDRDLTRLNIDIGKPGFVDTTRAMQPDANVLLPRGDGQVACLLYDPNDEVEAWWRIMTLGLVERARVLPNWAGGSDDFIYFVVNRTINGVTRRFIEKMAQRKDCVGGQLNQQLDCALVYQGVSVSTLQMSWLPLTQITVWGDGLDLGATVTDASGNFNMPDSNSHASVVAGLAGAVITGSANSPMSNNKQPDVIFTGGPTGVLTVGAQYNGYPAEVFADGAGTGRPLQHMGSVVVSGGVVQLPNDISANTIVACLGFVAPFMSAKLAYGVGQGGSALTQKKKIDHLGLILYDTAATGLLFGQSMDLLDPMPLVDSDQLTPFGTVWSEYDGPPVEVPGEWDTDARLCLLAQAPTPCMIGGAVVAMVTNEK